MPLGKVVRYFNHANGTSCLLDPVDFFKVLNVMLKPVLTLPESLFRLACPQLFTKPLMLITRLGRGAGQ